MEARILELCRQDRRFAYEAYEFVCAAVTYTQTRMGRAPANRDDDTEGRHVSGAELLKGTCELAIREFGMMAPVVFKQWGVRTTDHIGEIVFKLIDTQLLSKSDRDDPNDFHDLFDLNQALTTELEPGMCDTAKRGDR